MDRKRLYEVFAYTGNKESIVTLAEAVGYDVLAGLMEDEYFTSYITKSGTATDKTAISKRRAYALSKGGISCLLAIFFSDNDKVKAFYDGLSANVKQLLDDCAKHYVVLADDLDSTTFNGMFIDTRYGFDQKLSPAYSLLFDAKHGYSYNDYALVLSQRAKLLLGDFLQKDVVIDGNFQPDPSWRIFTLKHDIFQTIDSCRMLIKRDSLPKGKAPGASVCRKLAPVAGVDEIFTSGQKNWKWWRTMTLFMSISAATKYASPEDGIRKAVNWLLGDCGKAMYHTLFKEYFHPNLKGFYYSGLPDTSRIINLALDALKSLSDRKGCWLAFDDFMLHMRSMASDDSEFIGYCEENYRRDIQRVGTYNDLGYPLLYLYITEPVVKALFFIFASFGLADLAIDDDDDCYFSGYDPIRAVRLTSFGQYMLGFSDSYESVSCAGCECEVFENRLVVRLKSDSGNVKTLLSDVMDDLGGGRFVMTEASFLKNCRSAAEIGTKIDFFKSLVSPKKDLPKIWQDFFAAVKSKCGGLIECSMSGYVLYHIDPSREDLLRIFSTDSYILSHSTKVQGCRVLIEKSALPQILSKLRAMGYLIEK